MQLTKNLLKKLYSVFAFGTENWEGQLNLSPMQTTANSTKVITPIKDKPDYEHPKETRRSENTMLAA